MENYEEFRCDLFICVVERAQRLRFHRIGEQLPHPYWNTRCDCDLSGKFIFTCFKNRIVFIQWFYLRFHQSMDPHWKHFPFVRFRLFVRAKRHFESYRIILFFYFEFTKCANVNIIFWSVRSLSVRHCDNMRLEFFFFFLNMNLNDELRMRWFVSHIIRHRRGNTALWVSSVHHLYLRKHLHAHNTPSEL